MINKMIHPWFSALAIAAAVVFVSWSASSLPTGVSVQVYPTRVDSTVSSAPVASSQPAAATAIDNPPREETTERNATTEQSASPNTSVVTYRVDPNVFFPPSQGHELARDNCLNCHQLITFAYVRKTRDGWMRNRTNHVGRLSDLSEEQIGIIYEYLATIINPDLPIPDIPMSWVCSS
ncbi:MAG: hypothetical protein HZB51_04395 [Chloroflexi bacterium]|nr:hypothetical protein [Chloroflexota bacterium]